MKLDFYPNTGAFVLRVDPKAHSVERLMTEYGLDLSAPLTTLRESALFTTEPYAAASFFNAASEAARLRLGPIWHDVERSRADACAGHFAVPADQALWPYQGAGVAYAMARPHALIGDEPGLGKTMQAIVVANEMRARRVLVICPASIRYQWMAQINRWSTAAKNYLFPLISSVAGVHEAVKGVTCWWIVSWDLIRSPGIWRALAKIGFDLIIPDEVHMGKSRAAARTRALFGGPPGTKTLWAGKDPVKPLIECTQKMVALSGTPMPNRPSEIYTVAHGLCPAAIDWMSENSFKERFNPRKVNRTKENRVWIDERVGRMPELQNRLRANFMTRHLKRDVLTQLKLPVYDLVYVEETRAVRAALAVERLLDIDPENLRGADAKILGEVATARRLMGEAMAPQVADYIRSLLLSGEQKLAVFGWHISVLDILSRELSEFAFVRVDGDDGPRAKDAKKNRFIDDPDCRIIFGNVLSLGVGTDGLQSVCHHGLIAEPSWVHGDNVQCFDRLDRGGQARQVQGDIFVAPGSIAERVLASALRKAAVVYKGLDEKLA